MSHAIGAMGATGGFAPEDEESRDRAGTESPGRAPVRLRDVARAANVALSTASRALRGQPRINEETRRRVFEAAERLGYEPEQMRSLKRTMGAGVAGGIGTGMAAGVQPGMRIGVICIDLAGTFTPTILIGAENALQARSITPMLVNAGGNEALLYRCVEQLLAQDVAGLLIISRRTDPVPYRLDVPVPVVYAYGPSTDPADCSVVQDNVESGRMAVRHLLSCGRTRIAVIAGDRTYSVSHERLRGAEDALHEAGLELACKARFGPWDVEWGRAAVRLLLDDDPTFDAVVCQSDVIARGCVEELERNGRNVPQDVAVIGHDDREDYVVYAHPWLTSIDDGNESLGRMAALRLMDAIEGRPHHGVDHVAARLIQRESTLPTD